MYVVFYLIVYVYNFIIMLNKCLYILRLWFASVNIYTYTITLVCGGLAFVPLQYPLNHGTTHTLHTHTCS